MKKKGISNFVNKNMQANINWDLSENESEDQNDRNIGYIKPKFMG